MPLDYFEYEKREAEELNRERDREDRARFEPPPFSEYHVTYHVDALRALRKAFASSAVRFSETSDGRFQRLVALIPNDHQTPHAVILQEMRDFVAQLVRETYQAYLENKS